MTLKDLPNGKSHALDFVPNEFLKQDRRHAVSLTHALLNAEPSGTLIANDDAALDIGVDCPDHAPHLAPHLAIPETSPEPIMPHGVEGLANIQEEEERWLALVATTTQNRLQHLDLIGTAAVGAEAALLLRQVAIGLEVS